MDVLPPIIHPVLLFANPMPLPLLDATLSHRSDVCTDRRGSAYMALAKYKDALRDFKSVRQLKPSDRDALEKFKAADKEVWHPTVPLSHANAPCYLTATPSSQREIAITGKARSFRKGDPQRRALPAANIRPVAYRRCRGAPSPDRMDGLGTRFGSR